MNLCKIWIEQCEAARGVKDEFGVQKALAFLVGEKFLSCLEAADREATFQAELPAFVAEIKRIFERRQLAECLETARQTEPFDLGICEDADAEDIEMERRADLRRCCGLSVKGEPMSVTYRLEPGLPPEEFIDVLVRSTLAERRPVGDPGTIWAMLKNADVIVTALVEQEVMGLVARILGGGRRPESRPAEAAPERPASREPAKKPVTVKVGRETVGRRGKGVTTVFDLPLDDDGVRELAALLKQRCGTGGTVKDGRIEIQGDQRERVAAELEKLSYKVKRVGG